MPLWMDIKLTEYLIILSDHFINISFPTNCTYCYVNLYRTMTKYLATILSFVPFYRQRFKPLIINYRMRLLLIKDLLTFVLGGKARAVPSAALYMDFSSCSMNCTKSLALAPLTGLLLHTVRDIDSFPRSLIISVKFI